MMAWPVTYYGSVVRPSKLALLANSLETEMTPPGALVSDRHNSHGNTHLSMLKRAYV